MTDEPQHHDKAFVEEEEEEAALEASRIGGEVQQDSDDPAEQPLAEAGEGEAEGFELAEKDLVDIAEHGDEHRFPDAAVGKAEEPQQAEYGEADQEPPADE